jgi:hypothetical protein
MKHLGVFAVTMSWLAVLACGGEPANKEATVNEEGTINEEAIIRFHLEDGSILGIDGEKINEPTDSLDVYYKDYAIKETSDGEVIIYNLDEEAAACEEGTRGEIPTLPNEYSPRVRDCGYIDWCNEPGAREVVCRCKNSSCSYWELVLDCWEDADYVCGNWSRMSIHTC